MDTGSQASRISRRAYLRLTITAAAGPLAGPVRYVILLTVWRNWACDGEERWQE